MRRRVLITGANGFVGQHLSVEMRSCFPEAEFWKPHLELRDRDAVIETVRAVRPTCCIHLAAISSVVRAIEDPEQAWQVNLHGTLRLAEALATYARGCQLIFASSANAYGASFRSGAKLDETSVLAPIDVYGATKAAADLALGSMSGEALRVVRLRPFNSVGTGQSAEFVLASFARQIARIEIGLQPPVIEVGRLDTYRDFLDVKDACSAYLACISSGDLLPDNVILNVASGEARQIGHVLDSLIALSGQRIDVRQNPKRVRVIDIPTASGDASRAAALLGWRPNIAWQNTLKTLLADWRGRVKNEAAPHVDQGV